MPTTIYHNPNCGTSRNVLAMMQASGEAPEIIDYLATPPSRDELVALLARLQISASQLLRAKEAKAGELGLDADSTDHEALLDAMAAHPILINRPIVITPSGAALCRPSERVLALLETPVAVFEKEDGEIVYAPARG
ncbi:arsenate reductase (glutaredoxin) [uncultured Salinisphaera sp.]|uniref:arsenate reductase (glutaredoxin) n=1 Tax=uncultured Salinisphaera sp. TaxID=359372 RepID=UPI0032B24C93|tara:strand:+ start:236 stop:646 length:411 start_codon:yes stop_codon:yes gene_type:complete